jgi:two-component system secretion response regulator SsrB
MADRIRVFVVDDSESIRSSLAQMIDAFADLEWVGDSDELRHIFEICRETQPDIILLDVGLPHTDIADIIAHLRCAFPTLHIIGLTSFEEVGLIRAILNAGATLCLSKMASTALLVEAIRWATYTRAIPRT